MAAAAAAGGGAAGGHAATRAFFASGFGLALAVYDTRRGGTEGREAEKILAFYPPTAPGAMQSSIVGLAQALTMFAGTFNKECAHHSMDAAGHAWAMFHAEPDLWLLLVAGRGLLGPHCVPSSLSSLLRGVHAMAVLLHGLLSSQLEQDPSGVRMRLRLQPLLQEVAASLLQPEPAGLAALTCPLGLTGGVPLLPVSAAAFTRLQSLANSLLVARLFGCRPVQGVLVAWQTCLLWSSLGSADTAALHSLAVRGLEPAVREGPRHKTWRRPLAGGPQPPQSSPPLPPSSSATLPQSTSASSGGGLPPASPGALSSLQADCMCLACAACWQCRPDGLVLPVTLQGGGEQPGAAASSPPGCASLPVVWLQSGCEPARLMAWHAGPLLLLLLLEPRGPAVSNCSAVTASLQELLAQPAAELSGQLAAELPAKHLWHVKGLRYLYQDHLTAAVRASPLRKVATLSQASLNLTAEARQWTALEATVAADPTAPPLGSTSAGGGAAAGASSGSRSRAGATAGAALPGGSGSAAASDGGASSGSGSGAAAVAEAWEAFAAGGEDADVEVVVRGANDAWVVGRHTAAGRQLTAVVEGDRDRGLLGTMRRVSAFCDEHLPGVFEGLA